jgi:hypothetical protein
MTQYGYGTLQALITRMSTDPSLIAMSAYVSQGAWRSDCIFSSTNMFPIERSTHMSLTTCPHCCAALTKNMTHCPQCHVSVFRLLGTPEGNGVETMLVATHRQVVVSTAHDLMAPVAEHNLQGGLATVWDHGPSSETGPRDHVLIANDVSPSMEEPMDAAHTKRQAAQRAACLYVVQSGSINPLTHIGVISFSAQALLSHSLCPAQENKTSLLRCIQEAPVGDGTNLRRPLELALQTFDWNAPCVATRRVILLTDGIGGDPRPPANELKRRGVTIEIIGVGPHPSAVREDLLRETASVIHKEPCYRFIKDSQTLMATYTALAQQTTYC